MTRYPKMGLVLSCVVILSMGCSKAPEEHKGQGGLSAKNPGSYAVRTHKLAVAEVEESSGDSKKELSGFPKTEGDVGQSVEVAVNRAREEKKYLYLVFYKQGDQKSKEMKQVLAGVQKELSAKADVVYIDVTDRSAQTTIKKYGMDRAPIPITLVMASNGAIVAGFPEKANEDQLRNAFVSPKMAEIVKAIQDKKLVYLYIANRKMKYYEKNLALIQETARTDLRGVARVIEVDPKDKKEASLLKKCKAQTPVKQTTLLILNAGRVVGDLKGEFTKDILMTRTIKGCSGGSCCPKKK